MAKKGKSKSKQTARKKAAPKKAAQPVAPKAAAAPIQPRPAPMEVKSPAAPAKNPLKVLAMLAVLLLGGGAFAYMTFNAGPDVDYTEFAKCVAEKDVKFYGAFWCPNCGKVKATLGDAAKYINYIECDPRGENSQADLCIEKGIQKYHTFEYADGSFGERHTPQQLAEKTGCALPEGTPENWRG